MTVDTVKKSSKEKLVLAVFFFITKAMTGTYAQNRTDPGNAGYLCILISAAVSLLLGSAVLYICQKCRAPLFESIQICLGKAASKAFLAILLVTLMISARNIAYIFSDTVVNVSLPRSRLSVVALTFISAACAGAFFGIKGIFRFSMLLLPLSLISFFLIMVMGIPCADINHIFPFFGTGIKNISCLGLCASSDFFFVLFLGQMFDPEGERTENLQLLLMPILVCGIAACLLFLLTTLVFPYTYPVDSPLGDIILAVSISDIFAPLGSLFSFVWNSVFLITLCTHIYFAGYICKKLIGGKTISQRISMAVFSSAVLIFTVSDSQSMPAVLSFVYDIPKTLPLFIFSLPAAAFISCIINKKESTNEIG